MKNTSIPIDILFIDQDKELVLEKGIPYSKERICHEVLPYRSWSSGYAARRAELRRKAKEAARTRDRQAAASQDEAEENDATEEEMTRERTTRVGRPRGGMKVAARSGERLRREIGRGRLPRVGDG